jgi:hypothetical protein
MKGTEMPLNTQKIDTLLVTETPGYGKKLYKYSNIYHICYKLSGSDSPWRFIIRNYIKLHEIINLLR